MRIVSQLARVAAAAFATGLGACSLDVPGPPDAPEIEVKLDFCANDTPIWFAYQDDLNPFQVIEPDASGAFTFTVRYRVAIAYVRARGSGFRTDIIYASNQALEQLNDVVCLEAGGAKQVTGTLTGHGGTQLGVVAMSTSSATLPSGQSAYSLTNLVDRPLDLVASRVSVSDDEQQASKTVIRRAQNPANGAVIPVVDFDAEGFDPVANTAAVTGVGTLDAAVVSNTFVSQSGTSHTLSFVSNVIDGSVPFVSIPGGEMASGDYHNVSVTASASNGAVRGSQRFFRNPGNQGLILGPPLIEPTVSVLATSPSVRLRAQVQGQVDYSSMLNLNFVQPATGGGTTEVSLSVLASYFGFTPTEWNLPMPNFDGLPGWQNVWGLKTGSIGWTITAYFGRPQLLFGSPPNANDGEVLAFGSRTSTFTATSVQSAPAIEGAPQARDGRPRRGSR